MKILMFLVCLTPTLILGQNTLLFEDFNSGFPSWSIYNEDGLQPHLNVAFVTDAWVLIEDSDSTGIGDSCAVSTSWYDPAGQANDWMVLPGVLLGAGGNYLSWDGKSEDGVFAEDYEIRISTTGNSVSDFDSAFYSVSNENQYWEQRKISLDSFANQTVYIAFVNVSDDNYLLMIDNIHIVEQDPMGVDETYTAIKTYPNPVSDIVSIDYNFQSPEASLVAIDGSTIPVRIDNQRIDVSHVANGIYFLIVLDNDKVFRSKIIISK